MYGIRYHTVNPEFPDTHQNAIGTPISCKEPNSCWNLRSTKVIELCPPGELPKPWNSCFSCSSFCTWGNSSVPGTPVCTGTWFSLAAPGTHWVTVGTPQLLELLAVPGELLQQTLVPSCVLLCTWWTAASLLTGPSLLAVSPGGRDIGPGFYTKGRIM